MNKFLVKCRYIIFLLLLDCVQLVVHPTFYQSFCSLAVEAFDLVLSVRRFVPVLDVGQ